MRDIIIQLIMALTGSWGFAILFGVRPKLAIPASLCGMFGWAIYLVLEGKDYGIFIACFVAAAFTAVYSEVLARVLKAPATLFLVPSFIPLIPGSTLYYTMSNAVARDWEQVQYYGNRTWQYALAIAGGISLVLACSFMLTQLRKEFMKKTNIKKL